MSDEPLVFEEPSPTLPLPARTGDVISAVLAGLLAAAVSILPTGSIAWNVVNQGDPQTVTVLGLTSLWNLMVLGPSIYGVGRWWLWSTRQPGLTDRSFLWRVYWKVQWVTNMLIPALLILFCGICSTVVGL